MLSHVAIAIVGISLGYCRLKGFLQGHVTGYVRVPEYLSANVSYSPSPGGEPVVWDEALVLQDLPLLLSSNSDKLLMSLLTLALHATV